MSLVQRKRSQSASLLILLFATGSCALRQASVPRSAWLRENWAAGLPFASIVHPLHLGMSFRATTAVRPNAVQIKFVGLADSLDQWILQYRFPEGRRNEPRLTMEDWQSPDTGATLTSVYGYSFRKLARDAEDEWIGIVKRWRQGGVVVRCGTYSGFDEGKYAVAAQETDTAIATFEVRQPGWEGPPFDANVRSPLGYVTVQLVSRVPSKFPGLRQSFVRCP